MKVVLIDKDIHGLTYDELLRVYTTNMKISDNKLKIELVEGAV